MRVFKMARHSRGLQGLGYTMKVTWCIGVIKSVYSAYIVLKGQTDEKLNFDG